MFSFPTFDKHAQLVFTAIQHSLKLSQTHLGFLFLFSRVGLVSIPSRGVTPHPRKTPHLRFLYCPPTTFSFIHFIIIIKSVPSFFARFSSSLFHIYHIIVSPLSMTVAPIACFSISSFFYIIITSYL